MRAADFGYLVVEMLDGSTQSLPCNGLTMVFADGQLTAQSQGQTATFTQALLSKMYFSDVEQNGIGDAVDGQSTTIRVNDRLIQVAAPVGARVLIANVGGMLIDRFTAGAEPINTPVRPGIYIIKVNDKSTKIHVK
ncbi:MAG: hypothetical protein IJV45_11310 [Prevotella sp.]|nr:hypothetical protein [Prevotella sp.]